MKRLFDLIAALVGLSVLSPLLCLLAFLIWLQDRSSPFYVPQRVGKNGRLYRMIKFRSMIVRADRNKVDSTANNDPRITRLGHFVRRFKLDELPQLWNVLIGEMSLVGPRPNVSRETDLYTATERGLLAVRPGITDISSIVFADEGSILEGRPDPDLSYNQLIRPYKSRLGLLYVAQAGVGLDLRLIALTLLNGANRRAALDRIGRLVEELGGTPEMVAVSVRREPLQPAPPPGQAEIVTQRGLPA